MSLPTNRLRLYFFQFIKISLSSSFINGLFSPFRNFDRLGGMKGVSVKDTPIKNKITRGVSHGDSLNGKGKYSG